MGNPIEASPLQIKQLLFTKIEVEANLGEESGGFWAPDFDFQGVVIHTDVSVEAEEEPDEGPQGFFVQVKLAVFNDPDDEGKMAPYSFEIHSHAYFELFPAFDVERREKIVRVNGASMIVGAMRELLTHLTARSVHGPMTLPSLRIKAEEPSD